MELNKIYCGNCLDLLKQLPDKSIQCCVTSPPYLGLRNYNTESWEGGDINCKHEGTQIQVPPGTQKQASNNGSHSITKGNCIKCGAIRIDQQIGLEDSLDEYINKLVSVFAEVYRVLRNDGICFLNLGDSYNSYNGNRGKSKSISSKVNGEIPKLTAGFGLSDKKFKPKDLMLVPARVAIALQNWGWTVRSEIIWAKGISFNNKYSGSCMPESCKDRPTKSHETVYMLTKGPKYYYDIDSVREPHFTFSEHSQMKGGRNHFGKRGGTPEQGKNSNNPNIHEGARWDQAFHSQGRNLRSVWTINPKPFKGCHFATMPPKLIEPCIKAGTSEYGCCKDCGKPYKRIIEKGRADEQHKKLCGADSNGEYLGEAVKDYESSGAQNASEVKARILEGMKEVKTIGWKKDCKCETNEIKPCVCLDPFFGAGTVGLVSKQLGRDWIGFDLNESYCQMATDRINEILL